MTVTVAASRWARQQLKSGPAPLGFESKTGEVHFATLEMPRRGAPVLKGGIDGMEVLKTSGSGFTGFNKCKYTTLKPTTDRILSTVVRAEWTFGAAAARKGARTDYNAIYDAVRQRVKERLNAGYSASVQETLFLIVGDTLRAFRDIESCAMSLPNRHYLHVNVAHLGEKWDNTVFQPINEPAGLIHAELSRTTGRGARL